MRELKGLARSVNCSALLVLLQIKSMRAYLGFTIHSEKQLLHIMMRRFMFGRRDNLRRMWKLQLQDRE